MDDFGYLSRSSFPDGGCVDLNLLACSPILCTWVGLDPMRDKLQLLRLLLSSLMLCKMSDWQQGKKAMHIFLHLPLFCMWLNDGQGLKVGYDVPESHSWIPRLCWGKRIWSDVASSIGHERINQHWSVCVRDYVMTCLCALALLLLESRCL